MQIMRAVSALTIFIVAALNSGKLLAMIHLNDIMTPEEQKKTGVYNLSTTQKEQLELWINDKFVLKTVEEKPMPVIEENLRNGSEIKLSNGSSFAIAPSDQAKASAWISPVQIKISASGDPLFPVLLTNTLTGVSIKGKQVRPAAK
jgi:hypothetical protein